MRTPRPLIFILFVTAVLVASSCSGAGRGANNGGVDGGGSDAGSADASGFADGGGSGGSDAMFNPDTAAPDGSSMSDAGFDADASIPPQDPDPTCEGGGSDGQLPEGTIAGAVTTPHPTLNNITVEWAIEGDEDLDGAVRVRYREEGAPYWNRGMALRRIPAGETEGLPWGNRHSGSVFDLEPGTRYEIELWLVDPDGGCRFETVTVETRPLPTPMAGAPVKAVTPDTLEDTLSAAQPGDIIDLGPGTYDGFNVEVDGEPGKEIVIRSTQGAVIDGTVDASNREYVQIVGLTANRIRFDNSRRISIMGTP